ncbi:MAG TPA: hypothetical protein VGC99_20225 [Candidatus Tectomicrobia bacterium]
MNDRMREKDQSNVSLPALLISWLSAGILLAIVNLVRRGTVRQPIAWRT